MSARIHFYSPLRSFFTQLLLAGLLIACSGQNTKTPSPQPPPNEQTRVETLVYECSELDFVARVTGEEMAVWFEDRDLVLTRVPSASGEKYEGTDVVFWSKGEEAFLEKDNQRFDDCKLAPKRVPWEDARRRGVDFRAVGNEPGWYVEVRHDSHILLVADYGNTRVLMTQAVSSTKGEVSIYSASSGNDEMRVEIVDEACTDTMAGDTFASQVRVTHGVEVYHGCGTTLTSDWE